MKILSDDLKRILTSLAHQNAGELLSMREKMKVLRQGAETWAKPSSPAQNELNIVRREKR